MQGSTIAIYKRLLHFPLSFCHCVRLLEFFTGSIVFIKMTAIQVAITSCVIQFIISSVRGQESLPVRLPPLNSSQCPIAFPANYSETESATSTV